MSKRWLAYLALLGWTGLSAAQSAVPVTLRAVDGVEVSALSYEAAHPRALILLFHQAGSGKGEYATIAPRLAKAGYSSLAVDQRSGGGLFGTNQTAAKLGHDVGYLDAKPDLVAALRWAEGKHLPIVLWGSSYSSSLVFVVAAENPGKVAAVMAFSPGEYFDDKTLIRRAAAKVTVPIYVTSSSEKTEVDAARDILAASPSTRKVQYVPPHGVHGASTLIAGKDPQGADENWNQVLGFLGQLTP
ncbi:alpha/beta hydrolase [Luteibacter sp. CQ10]|uniref:alpha/beta hydrolase n=1 Tax=Luteibacter sp. CQ10 TaxID=2805821 RepID=UPI0034A2A568